MRFFSFSAWLGLGTCLKTRSRYVSWGWRGQEVSGNSMELDFRPVLRFSRLSFFSAGAILSDITYPYRHVFCNTIYHVIDRLEFDFAPTKG